MHHRNEIPSFRRRRHFLVLAVVLLVSSSLNFFSHGASCSSHPNRTPSKLEGLRREVLEGGNGTLVLAAERTHRRDPLNHFQYYTGGWNVTDSHYLASVAFSAVPLIVIAIVWFVLLGLFLICACLCCCCCGCGVRAYGYSRVCYTLSLTFLILFTLATIIGCAMLYTGQREFYNSVEETFKYIIRQATGVLRKLTGLWDSIKAAKDIQLDGQYLFPLDYRNQIDQFSNMIHMSNSTLPDRVSNNTIHYLTGALNPVRNALNVTAGVMLGVAFLGLLLSLCGLRVLVYLLVILGWILVTTTIILSAIFLIFHNVVADTCMAMDQWVQNPAAESTLSQLLPCMDRKTVEETLNISKVVSFESVNMVNAYITNISNHDFPPDIPLLNHNQSGPLVPLLCNPLDPELNPQPCPPGEIDIANASQEYKRYVCQVDPKGICVTQGRLTPSSYDHMMGAINVGLTVNEYSPFLASLADCTFVEETFRDISKNHCPGLSLTSQWIYAGLALVSGAVMLSLILWMIFVRERRHRARTKRSMLEMQRF